MRPPVLQSSCGRLRASFTTLQKPSVGSPVRTATTGAVNHMPPLTQECTNPVNPQVNTEHAMWGASFTPSSPVVRKAVACGSSHFSGCIGTSVGPPAHDVPSV